MPIANFGPAAVSGFFMTSGEGPLKLILDDGSFDDTTIKVMLAADGSIADNGDGTVTVTIP